MLDVLGTKLNVGTVSSFRFAQLAPVLLAT